MQCGIEERVVRSVKMAVVRCFRCEGEGHKCRECPLWERKVKRVVRSRERKAHQGERKLRRTEKEKVAHPVKRKTQQEWRRSSWEELRKRAEWYCGPTVPQDAEL